MAENIERTKSVRYSLFSSALGELVLDQEPRGYNDDTRSYQRIKGSRAILTKTKISLEFFSKGAAYLTTIFRSFGISEKVLLTKYVKDTTSLSESWKFRYVQKVDMGKFDVISKQGNVTVDATDGDLYSDINNRKSDKYDIINTESADGKNIGNLVTKRFVPQPRGIFTDSLLRENEKIDYRVSSNTTTGQSSRVRTIPNKIVYNTIEDVKEAWLGDDSYNDKVHVAQGNFIDPSNIFFYQAEKDTTLQIKMQLTFTITEFEQSGASNKRLLVLYQTAQVNNDLEDVLMSSEDLLEITDPDTKVGQEFSTPSFDREIFVPTGGSLAFVLNTRADLSNGFVGVHLNVTKSVISVEDKTPYGISEGKCIKFFDLFERLVAKITGENGRFKSTVFGVGGEYENMVVDNGFFARGFPDVFLDDNDVEKRIQFNTSFQDAFNSGNYLEPLAWFIDIEGSREIVRIEKATYTMKNFIGLSLTAVDNIQSKASKPDFFSKVILGHKKNVEYEQVNGLEEPNGKSEFNTHITEGNSTYSVVSEYRTDPTGYELTRREQFSVSSRKDTKYDEDIWMHDTKVDAEGIHTHNLWADRFDSSPTGIFDPETAWNLWLSPMNRLFYGHGYSVIRGLYHFSSAKIRFASSNANQNLRTIIGGVELHEGGNITIDDIENPRIEAEIPSVTFKMTQKIEDTLTGFTEIDGELVPNFFGLIEYLEKGDLRYGRLTKLDGDKESKLIMQKARL